MTSSIEVLRQEGLLSLTSSNTVPGPDALLELSSEGHKTLITILSTGLQAPLNDVARLVLALKFRFLHLLPDVDRRKQLESIIYTCETDLARLVDLKSHHNQDPGYLGDWLDHDIGQTEDRLVWLKRFLTRVEEDIRSA
tara:strand:- start:4586 stop:5002 length:417 start_codon:yes stop_codon:yes gene_type:complete